MSWHPLRLWHHIHYIRCHTQCFYDNTSSISDLEPILSAITSTVYVTTPTLSNISNQLCKTSQVAYVCHHVHYTWHHIHPIRQHTLVFMASHALYWWHHMHDIWHVIYCLWYHIHYMCDITQCLISDITHSMFMTYPLYMASHTVLWQHNHCVTSQPLCLTSLPQYLCHNTN